MKRKTDENQLPEISEARNFMASGKKLNSRKEPEFNELYGAIGNFVDEVKKRYDRSSGIRKFFDKFRIDVDFIDEKIADYILGEDVKPIHDAFVSGKKITDRIENELDASYDTIKKEKDNITVLSQLLERWKKETSSFDAYIDKRIDDVYDRGESIHDRCADCGNQRDLKPISRIISDVGTDDMENGAKSLCDSIEKLFNHFEELLDDCVNMRNNLDKKVKVLSGEFDDDEESDDDGYSDMYDDDDDDDDFDDQEDVDEDDEDLE